MLDYMVKLILLTYTDLITDLSRFLTAHQHTIQCHSRWFTLENTGQKTN